MAKPWILKRKTQFNIGLTLLTIYFIYTGFSNIFNNQYHAQALDQKLQNFESSLMANQWIGNKGFRRWLPFQGSEESEEGTPLSRIIVFIYGAVLLLSSSSMYFFDDRDKRNYFGQILFIATLVDIMIFHQPFVEDRTLNNYERDMTYSILAGGISCGLLIVLGLRHR